MTSTYNSTGVTLDGYTEIRARYVALSEAEWGDSVNTAEDAFLGHTFSNIALIQNESNESVQDVYDGGMVSSATGARLDGIVELVGLERQAAAYSTVTLTLTADRAVTVNAGTLYGTSSKVNFAIDSQVVFTGAGSADVSATCTVVGANEAAIGEVDQIVTSVTGITAVTNAAIAEAGRLRQTDAELKAAHTLHTATSGESDAGDIYNALIEVSGVSAAYVFDNDTQSTIGGVPAGNIHCSVIGGSDADVAEAIFLNKAGGIPTHGSNAIAHYDTTTGQTKTMNFDRATATPIYIALNITKVGGLAEDDVEDQIREQLVTHFSTFRIADDVVYKSLYKPVHTPAGVIVNTMYTGTAASPTGTADITRDAEQLAQLTTAQSLTNVTITVT